MLFERLDPRTALISRLVLLGLVVWSLFSADQQPGLSGRGLAVTVLAAIATAAWLVWLRRRLSDDALAPELFVLSAAGGLLLAASPDSGASAFVFVAVTATALRGGLTRAAWVIAAGALTLAVGVILYSHDSLSLLLFVFGFVGISLAGSNARMFRQRAEQAELLLAQSQRSREEALRAARLEESARLAREIHDVLAHSLAGLSIQLEATTALLENGAASDQILARVRRAHELARDGLRETRRAVGALRGEEVPLAQALQALADNQGATLSLEGELSRVGSTIAQAVIRVVQESLTNAAKHAPGAEVAITAIAGDELIVTVEDRHASVPVAAGSLADSGGGYGIAGMRERAQALGGTLHAGPTAHGWRVGLTIPLIPQETQT